LHVLKNGSFDIPEPVRDAADSARVHIYDPEPADRSSMY
jgi:hypothetical protein